MRIDRKFERCKGIVALGTRQRLFRQAIWIENRPLVDGTIRDGLSGDARHGLDDVHLRIEQPAVVQTEIEDGAEKAQQANQIGKQNAASETFPDGARDPAVCQPGQENKAPPQCSGGVEYWTRSIGKRLSSLARRAGQLPLRCDVVAVERHPVSDRRRAVHSFQRESTTYSVSITSKSSSTCLNFLRRRLMWLSMVRSST